MMEFLDAPLLQTAAFLSADDALTHGKGPVRISGAADSQKVHIMMKAGGTNTRLLVTYDEQAALGLLEDARLFSKELYYFPAKDLLFYQADARSNTLIRERIRVLKALRSGSPVTVVTTVQALMNAMLPSDLFESRILNLKEGDISEISELQATLVTLGYERTASVEEPGEFAVHGGIVDVYDLTADNPFRIEFFDNEIDTIREFNPSSQLSVRRKPEISIYPAGELVLTNKELLNGMDRIRRDFKKNLEILKARDAYDAAASLQSLSREVEDAFDRRDTKGVLEAFLPYFYGHVSYLEDYLPDNALFSLEEPLRMREYGHLTETEFVESFKLRLEKGLTLPENAKIMRSLEESFGALETGRTAVYTALDSRLPFFRVRESFRIEGQPLVSYFGNFEGLVEDLKRYERLKFSVVLLVQSRTRGSRMAEELREYKVHAFYTERSEEAVLAPGQVLVTYGSLRKGYLCPLQKFLLITENDLFTSREKKKRKKQSTANGEKLRSYQELSAGDYVVHENYGIGIYRGIVNLETDGVGRDYMQISYGTSGTLYIPVTNLDVV
ncbi:MAG: hypothetical protein IKY02_00320 [Lachnospiraceae bacterium]|nr:hypothetical protein [Lachnospiraceae bacterium]